MGMSYWALIFCIPDNYEDLSHIAIIQGMNTLQDQICRPIEGNIQVFETRASLVSEKIFGKSTLYVKSFKTICDLTQYEAAKKQ